MNEQSKHTHHSPTLSEIRSDVILCC